MLLEEKLPNNLNAVPKTDPHYYSHKRLFEVYNNIFRF